MFGVTFGCPVAIGFAASYPDRVQALVLAGGFAKPTRLGEFDFEAGPGLVDEWAGSTARRWGSGAVFGARAPSMRDSARYLPAVGGPDGAAHLLSWFGGGAVPWAATIDVRPLLAGLRVPVLVIHRQGDSAVLAPDGRYLAEHIPGAEYAELVSAGRRGDAVELYQTKAVGIPQVAAEMLPNGRLAVLPGQGHDINPGATAPVMAEFLAS